MAESVQNLAEKRLGAMPETELLQSFVRINFNETDASNDANEVTEVPHQPIQKKTEGSKD